MYVFSKIYYWKKSKDLSGVDYNPIVKKNISIMEICNSSKLKYR